MIEEKNILRNALLFAEENKSKYTGCIHYKSVYEKTRDVVPLCLNILYSYCQVATLSKEKAQKGLLFLERMFHFLTEDGFVRYIHDFPTVYSDEPNVYICLTLFVFLENFGSVIPALSRKKIEGVYEQLVQSLGKRDLKPFDRMLYQVATKSGSIEIPQYETFFEYEKVVLAQLLQKEEVVLAWHKDLQVYGGPLSGVFYDGHSPIVSLFGQIVTGDGVDSSSLYAALLPKGFSSLVSYETYERADLFINHQKEEMSIHFASHSLVAKGEMDIKVTGNHIDFYLSSFEEEVEFFFSDYKESKVFVEGDRATAFYPKDVIEISAEGQVFTLSFHSPSTNFMGHIMKGNRWNQLQDTNKNFTLFDHRIHLKKVY